MLRSQRDAALRIQNYSVEVIQAYNFAGRTPEALLISGDDIRRLLTWPEAVSAVEAAFYALGTGSAPAPGALGFHIHGGGFHVKAGLSAQDGGYFATKINANLPNNHERGLPTIQGVLALFSALDGRLLALIDSIELTARRTGAATAVAAKYLARADASTLTIVGCGAQAYAQIRAVCEVRSIERVFTYDVKEDASEVLAHRIEHDLDIEAEAVPALRVGTHLSDIIITCTPSHKPVLFADDVRPGTFVAAVGADNPQKHEIDAGLLQRARVVADVLAQCRLMGDLHHADVATVDELAAFVARLIDKPPSRDEIIVFDSTGIAVQDVFAAAHVYEKALQPVHS